MSGCSTSNTNDSNQVMLPLTQYTVTINNISNGVVSDGNDINCGSNCVASYDENTQVSLEATAMEGYRFEQWQGEACDEPFDNICQFSLSQDTQLTAVFIASENDCEQEKVLCVDDSNTAQQEYSNIQDAIDDAAAGTTVVVFDGIYEGFEIYRSGTESERLTVKAQGSNVIVNRRGIRSDAIIRLTNVSYVTLDGFIVNNEDQTQYGIAARGASASSPMTDNVVKNNQVFNSASTNIYLSQFANSLIEANIAANSSSSHGIYLANGGSDNTNLKANVSYNNAKNGIHFNGDLRVGSTTDGLHTGIIMESNILYDNVANGIDMDGVQDSIIRNNLIYANGRNAVRGFKIDGALGPKRIHIYNNTFVDNNGWSIKMTNDTGGHIIFNNILSDQDGSVSLNVSDFWSDFNVTNNAFRVNADSEGPVWSLDVWQSNGYGSQTFMAEKSELFSNASSFDYSLSTLSKALNKGTPEFNNIEAPNVDIQNNSRPIGGAVDIGAYERQ